MSNRHQSQQATLFLLRTYNDIDHIVPVIWKTANSGQLAYFTFVDQPHLDDYRIKFVMKAGAIHLRFRPIVWYHQRLRRWIFPRLGRRLADRFLAYTLGSYILRRNCIRVIASEWSGVFGREMAEYFLRAGNRMKLQCISLPHGYIIWENREINQLEVDLWKTKRERPDLSERNIFSSYIVQNEDARRYYLDRGVWPEKIKILGSARFCPEWFSINYKLTRNDRVGVDENRGFTVLFFVPDWSYNVNRKACVVLMKKISELNTITLMIKANTRGTGSFSREELDQFSRRQNVSFPDIGEHSAALICSADIVINFASSIGIEAILQGKPVCNPVYLNGNTTIFDNSGVVFDAKDDKEVLDFFEEVKRGNYERVSNEILNKFLFRYVLGSDEIDDVLTKYADLFSKSQNYLGDWRRAPFS